MTYEEWPGYGGAKPDQKTGVAPDYANAWMRHLYLLLQFKNPEDGLRLDPNEVLEGGVRTYEEYINSRNHGFEKEVLHLSDANVVKQLDELVGMINVVKASADDYSEFEQICSRADELIRGTS